VTVESVNLKPGVLFVQTLSGGVLMDITADRFIALTPLSALIWSSLASGQRTKELIDKIRRARGVRAESAEALVTHQLVCWEKADLINSGQSAEVLPQPKASPTMSPAELSMATFQSEPLVPWLVASFFIVEFKYRRAIAKRGLAKALVSLQGEDGPPVKAQEAVIVRTIRNYHALRRAFRQGDEARDCLFRSVALAAVLRRQGVQADLCIGIIDLPFSSHAWVEAHGFVVNETLSKRKDYTIIGRF